MILSSELSLCFGWRQRFRRHLLCSLKAVELLLHISCRRALQPGRAHTQRLLVSLIESFTVAVSKCALRLAFVWFCSLRHSCADCDSEQRGDLHNKVNAFHVKYPFKSGLPFRPSPRHSREGSEEGKVRDSCALSSISLRMVSSYPLPEGFSDFDVFSLGSCLLVEGEWGFFLPLLCWD